jgi:hypothetical protein
MSIQKSTVFYSWQSDRPNNINRGFIEKALEVAAKNIRNDDSIAIDPVIDRDTSGVPGSPDIAHTILAKIDHAQIFVCDVSIITTSAEDRPSPNPNVLVELGYALKTIGPERVILVMNTAFGGPEQLPFDLRARRTVVYRAIEGEADRSTERRNLENRLTEALRAVLARLTQLGLENRAQAFESLRKMNREQLGKVGSGETPIQLVGSARMVLRTIPLSVLDSSAKFNVAALKSNSQFQLLMNQSQCISAKNRFESFITWSGNYPKTEHPYAYVQFFPNGCAEYVSAYQLIDMLDAHPVIPSELYEQDTLAVIPHLLAVQESLGIAPPILVSFSLLNVKGHIFGVDQRLQLSRVMRGHPKFSSIDEDNLIADETIVDTFKPDVDRVMQPLFDSIWNAADWEKSMNYDSSGKWVGQPK